MSSYGIFIRTYCTPLRIMESHDRTHWNREGIWYIGTSGITTVQQCTSKLNVLRIIDKYSFCSPFIIYIIYNNNNFISVKP